MAPVGEGGRYSAANIALFGLYQWMDAANAADRNTADVAYLRLCDATSKLHDPALSTLMDGRQGLPQDQDEWPKRVKDRLMDIWHEEVVREQGKELDRGRAMRSPESP